MVIIDHPTRNREGWGSNILKELLVSPTSKDLTESGPRKVSMLNGWGKDTLETELLISWR